MRILVAGEGTRAVYEPAFAEALGRLGHEVRLYSWKDVYDRSLRSRIQYRFQAGPRPARIERELLAAAEGAKPDLVLVWRGTPVRGETVRRLKALPGVKAVVSYNNDDPFGTTGGDATWRRFKAAIPDYDGHFVYRERNVGEYLAAGARRAWVLRSYYLPSIHAPGKPDDAFGLVFVGHHDPGDRREDHLRALVDAGLPVRVYGARWSPGLLGRLTGLFFKSGVFRWSDAAVARSGAEFHPPVEGTEYARLIGGASAALNFLSTANRDTYTRRCFEIPACGTVLLSVRTDDLRSLFREDEEAVFFSSPEELVAQARRLRDDPARRRRIADAGRARVLRDGHDVDSRAREFLDRVREVAG